MKAMWHLVAIPLLTFFITASDGKPCKPDRLDKRLAKAFHNKETEWWFCCDCKRASRPYVSRPITAPIEPKGVYEFEVYRRGTKAGAIVEDLIKKYAIHTVVRCGCSSGPKKVVCACRKDKNDTPKIGVNVEVKE